MILDRWLGRWRVYRRWRGGLWRKCKLAPFARVYWTRDPRHYILEQEMRREDYRK